MGRSGTEIGVRFKPLPTGLFENQPALSPNTIVFLIQPEPGIILSMASKEPGGEIKLTKTDMTMCFNQSFEKEAPEAYERLLVDAVRGDHTLFVNAREAELSWKLLADFLDKGELGTYSRG